MMLSIAANRAKTRWNAKHYTQIKVAIDPEIALEFKAACNAQGVSMARVLSAFMAEYSGKFRRKTDKPSVDYSTRRERRTALKRILLDLEQVKAGEEELINNAPENLRAAPMYENAGEYVLILEEAIEQLETIY